MIPPEILRQIRRLHLRARRVVEDLLGGEYHSVFKGTGIAFDEVREYQAGDDIRSIDWNVTARTGHPFVKRFIEERELTVLLLVDCSGSQQFGSFLREKREVAAELAAVLAFSAVSNNDRVGLIQFTDRVEHYVAPSKGVKHVLRVVRDVLCFQPKQTGTCLREALDFLNRITHRRVIAFLMSDFLDASFEQSLKRAGRRHDLIAIRIADPAEETLPAVGLIGWEDPESGVCRVVDSSNSSLRERFAQDALSRREQFRQVARSAGVDVIEVTTQGDHLEQLIRFYRAREHRQQRG